MDDILDKHHEDVNVSPTRLSLERAKATSKVEVKGFLSRDDHEMALIGKKQQFKV